MRLQNWSIQVCDFQLVRFYLLTLTVIQHWDYFSSCIYTQQEYARDQNDFQWELRGRQFSYKAIFLYFRRLVKSQQFLLNGRIDTQIFTASLPHLSNLSGIKLSFYGAQEDQLLWFSNRIFLSGEDSLLVHFETIFRAMAAAQAAGCNIKSIEIDGMHSKLSATQQNIVSVAEAALTSIERVKVANSSGFLDSLGIFALPSMQQLELENCWHMEPALTRFLRSQERSKAWTRYESPHTNPLFGAFSGTVVIKPTNHQDL